MVVNLNHYLHQLHKCYENYRNRNCLAVDGWWAVCKLEKSEKRAVIKYLHMKGMSSKETHEDMRNILADGCPSY